jgi:hypothetical protein
VFFFPRTEQELGGSRAVMCTVVPREGLARGVHSDRESLCPFTNSDCEAGAGSLWVLSERLRHIP